MTDITSLGFPLVYKAAVHAPVPSGLRVRGDNIALRTAVRALTGMQKEALIYMGPTGTVWRMVSDEGPYLDGTDLAPFPLAFFTAGMAFSFVDELLKHAKGADVTLKQVKLTQDNFYTMQGSALRGDMIGGALPAEMQLEIDTDAADATVQQLVTLAEKTCPAQRYMTEKLTNTFSLSHNGQVLSTIDVAASPHETQSDPTIEMAAARPLPPNPYTPDIITKLATAKTVFGVEGGAGSSLQATQKRTLHVRGICTVRPDGLKEATVQLFKPLGSTFRFLGDDTEQERAPSSLAYLATGVGFCFMTQIGRYATITKQDLKAYSIVQDTVYQIEKRRSKAEPVDTHTFLHSGETDETAQKTLAISERTCFLHAAMRGSNQTKMTVKWNLPLSTT